MKNGNVWMMQKSPLTKVDMLSVENGELRKLLASIQNKSPQRLYGENKSVLCITKVPTYWGSFPGTFSTQSGSPDPTTNSCKNLCHSGRICSTPESPKQDPSLPSQAKTSAPCRHLNTRPILPNPISLAMERNRKCKVYG